MVLPYHNNFSWVKEHEKLADKEIRRIAQLLEKKYSRKRLPMLPPNPLDWIRAARPIVEGKPRNLLVAPFWKDIYLDNYSIKMVVGGRQIFKSTYATDMLAYTSTVNPGTQACYVTYEQASLTAFSKQKLQIGTFSQNPVLGMFSRNKLGNIGEISLKNDSTIYCVNITKISLKSPRTWNQMVMYDLRSIIPFISI